MKIRRLALLASLAVAAAIAIAPSSAEAQRVRLGESSADSTRAIPRLSPQRAQFGIVTEDRKASLLLSDRGVVLQLTDHGLEEIRASVKRDVEKDGVFARLIGAVVSSGITTLLDHGIEVPYADLADARYEDGRLFLVDLEGNRVFTDVQINDSNVMQNFRARDANEFVARFRAVKARGR